MPLEDDMVALLHERIGFNPGSIGEDKLFASVRSWLKGRCVENPAQFLAGLRRGNQAFQDLVDAVVIPETWFFRDGEPFELLKRFASEWALRPGHQVLRGLSLPCSSGEEPYSIAMTLFEGGLMPERFSIDAVDICPVLLDRARQGRYGRYSFRGVKAAYRERYFEARGEHFELRAMVRERVRFEQGNLLDPHLMPDGRQYDFIFCRNLLIYFDAPAWKSALKTLDRLLKDTGLLFVGHAEMIEMTAPQFESVRFPGAFAYRKRASGPMQVPHAAGRAVAPSRLRKAMPATSRATSPTPPRRAATPEPEKVPDLPDLSQAGKLADAGRLTEAEAACQAHLAGNPGSAPAYFLLGLIREADGQTREAEGCYQRALYLDSKHEEAMIHLALMLERRGDREGAAQLRRRAKRARQTS